MILFKKFPIYTLFFNQFFSVFGFCNDSSISFSQTCCSSPYGSRFVIRHIESEGIGYNQGYTTLETFLSKTFSNWLSFADLRGHIFNNARFAGNAGLGLRYLSQQRVWGLNSYYDFRNSCHQFYNRWGLGLETLGQIWDFRFNGYLMFGHKTSKYQAKFDHFSNHFMFLSRKREISMSGFNAEVGAHVNWLQRAPVYFAMGPYYLGGKKQTWGGRTRVGIDIYDTLRMEASASYDHLFKWVGQGEISLTIPFGKKEESSFCCFMKDRAIQKVDRFEIIPLSHQHEKSIAIDPTIGLPYFFVFVDNQGHSNGTYESRYENLALAEEHSKSRDIIYLFEGDGSPYTTGYSMKDFQRLWGSGINQNLQTQWGRIVVPPFTSKKPIVTSNLPAIITLANGCEVSGIHLTFSEGNSGFLSAIFGENITDALIHHNFFDLAFQNTVFDNEEISGISVADNGQGNMTILNNVFNISQGTEGIITGSLLGISADSHAEIDTTHWKINKNSFDIVINGTITGGGGSLFGIEGSSGADIDRSIWEINQNQLTFSNNGSINGGLLGFGSLHGIDLVFLYNLDENSNRIINQNQISVVNNGQCDFLDEIRILSLNSSDPGEEHSRLQTNRNILTLINNTSCSSLQGIQVVSNSNTMNFITGIINKNQIFITNNGAVSGPVGFFEGIGASPHAGNGQDFSNWKIDHNFLTLMNNGSVTDIDICGIDIQSIQAFNNNAKWAVDQNKITIINQGDFKGFTLDTSSFGIKFIFEAQNNANASLKIYKNDLALENLGHITGGNGGDGVFSGIFVRPLGNSLNGNDQSRWQIDANHVKMINEGTIEGGNGGNGLLCGIFSDLRMLVASSNWEMNHNCLTMINDGSISGGTGGESKLFGIFVNDENYINNSNWVIDLNKISFQLSSFPDSIRGIYFNEQGSLGSVHLDLIRNFSLPYEIEIEKSGSVTLEVVAQGNQPTPIIH